MSTPSEQTQSSTTRFAAVFIILLIILSAAACRLTSSVRLQGTGNVSAFTDELSGLLEEVAIVRARSLVPDAKWLQIDGDPDSQVSAFIEENVGNTVRSEAERLSRDPNLAWTITYDGRQYEHNWKDSYDQDQGSLDYTIRSSNGRITYSGAIQPTYSFSRYRTILVNASLVPEERLRQYGNEYQYSLLLPNGFSIHFYIPQVISPNGETIAQIAADINQTAFDFCTMYGSLIVVLFILLYRFRAEEHFRPLVRLCRMKAALVILTLGGLFALASIGLANISISFSDGNLHAYYASFNLNSLQAMLASVASVFIVWYGYFMVVAMMTLYIKRIFKIGSKRFVEEDSAIYWAANRIHAWVMDSFSVQSKTRPEFRLTILALGSFTVMMVFMTLGAVFFDLPGFLTAGLISLILAVILIAAIGRSVGRNYQKVYDASRQLAEGNFSDVQPQHVGMYQRLYNELLHVSDSYETALKDGLSSQVSKAQLISNVSHDLKTPVAGIISYSELITMTEDTGQIQDYASHLQNYATRLNDLIEDLFDIARATSGDMSVELVRIDLAELIEQVEAEWVDSFQNHHLEPVLQLQHPVMIDLDPGKTVRIIENLFGNIRKYSMPGTRVFISLTVKGNICELTMRNTSRTILDFDPDRIMDRFVRGDASRHESGSGLGLAIVKSFVEVQNGTFNIETDGDIFRAIIRFMMPAPAAPVHDLQADQELKETVRLTPPEKQSGNPAYTSDAASGSESVLNSSPETIQSSGDQLPESQGADLAAFPYDAPEQIQSDLQDYSSLEADDYPDLSPSSGLNDDLTDDPVLAAQLASSSNIQTSASEPLDDPVRLDSLSAESAEQAAGQIPVIPLSEVTEWNSNEETEQAPRFDEAEYSDEITEPLTPPALDDPGQN